MNYNQLWSANRGRSRGNRGCGRGRRGAANMHYRGGHTFHRGVPPLLNAPEPFYTPARFRGPQESYSQMYSRPLNQELSWPLIRNRHSFTPNSRQAYLPATRVQPQLPNRSTSPLPGTEEYMQRNICEKSAFLKRQLELEGFNNSLNNFDLFEGDYQSDNTNNNFDNNTYQKCEEAEDDKPTQANENVPSPRRNKKPRQLSERVMTVEEIHEKIINHISNLSHGKKINLVNLPGPSGYDIAIQEITRQKRMELSKVLRDICNDKFKETADSGQVINSIIPDFDIKIEELPRELVEQLSSTLNENVTERIHNMCINPELMFQQAAEMLNNSLNLDKNVEETDVDKVDFNYADFSAMPEHERTDLNMHNIEDSSLGLAIEESMNQTNMLNFQNSENSESSHMNFDTSQSVNFSMSSPMNYTATQSCPTPYDIEFPDNTNVNRNVLDDPEVFAKKCNVGMDHYSPNHESSNSSFFEIMEHRRLKNVNPTFELMDIQVPGDMLLPTSQDDVDSTRNMTSDLMSEEAELAACLARTNPDLNLFEISSGDKICRTPNKNYELIKEEDAFSNIIDNAEKESLVHTNESQEQQIVEDEHDNVTDKLFNTSTSSNNENPDCDNSLLQAKTVTESEKRESRSAEKLEERSALETTNKSNTSKKKDKGELSDCTKRSIDKPKEKDDQKLKLDLDLPSNKKVTKDKKSKSKSKDNESHKKSIEDEQQERKQTDKRNKSKHVEDDPARKSIEKEEFYDRAERKSTWDKYSPAECSKEYTNEDAVSGRKRQDRKQDEKKLKGKYDEDHYRSDKYDRNKYDTYQQPYDDNYKKKHKDSGIDDDKHRRSDPYHYSKYSGDTDEGRNSKRHYQDKVSSHPHRQDYDYPYHKYDYQSPEYYQKQDSSYAPEEYDQKLHYSKSHKNKHKKHVKKHKRHRDHSSGSNASSSGSEKNSTTSSSYKTKHVLRPVDLCESPEDGATNRHPKTSLKERIQVLCHTKMRNFNIDQTSPKFTDDMEHSSSMDNLHNGMLMDVVEKNVPLTFTDDVDVKVKMESFIMEDDKSTEIISKETFESEEELKAAYEMEALECKKYSQRPWKSPGEKKFMMEHLNQNPAHEEEDHKIDIDLIDINDIKVEEDQKDIFVCELEESINRIQDSDIPIEQENNCTPLQETENSLNLNLTESDTIPATESDKNQSNTEIAELNQTKLQEINILHSAEVSSTSESAGLKLEAKIDPIIAKEKSNVKTCDPVKKDLNKMLVTTYTQTDSDKDHSHKKNKKDVSKDKTRETTHKDKLKSRQNSFTQTIVINATTSTQTHKHTEVNKNKTTQTDIIVDSSKEIVNVEVLENISKQLRRKRCVERMFEIDKEIEKLIKQRQAFYNLLNLDSDSEKEVDIKVVELDDSKQKRAHKEKPKTSRETKPLSLETNRQKQNQNSLKTNVAKTPSPQKIETERKAVEPPIDDNVKEPNAIIPPQEVSTTKIKLKRGRRKKNQDRFEIVQETTSEKNENIPDDIVKSDHSKKAHVKEEAAKEVKLDATKSKSASKDKVESSRKRKNKEKVPDEHSKSVGTEVTSSKRHKGEPQELVEIVQTPVEVKIVETEAPATGSVETKCKLRKKQKEIEDKVDDTKKMEEDSITIIEDLDKTVNNDIPVDVTMTPTIEEDKESELNGSVPSEENLQVLNTEVVSMILEPKTFIVPEVGTSAKKKKRRLSGVLDYRKKKKKSRKKNKRAVTALNLKILNTKTAVNVTRFSLTQLEEMRDEIRNKKVADTSESSEIQDDDYKIDDSCNPMNVTTAISDSSIISDEEKDAKVGIEENAGLTISTDNKNTSDSKDFTIQFKNFNGAILVIKVIDSTVLAASDKGQLLYFNMNNGEMIKTIDVSKLAVTSLVVAKPNENNLIYTGSLDSCLSIIDFNSKDIVKQETLSEPIQCMESSWGFIFVGSDRGSITRYDLNLNKVVDSLKVSSFNILMIKASQEGPRKVLIVAMRNSPVCVRDAISGLLLRTMQTSFSPTVYTLLIDKNLIYCGTSQHDILVYTFENGQLLFQHEATKSKGVVCMQIVGNLLLAGCYNGNIYVYNTKNNVYLGTMNGPGGLMLSMEIVDDMIIVGTKSSNFRAWKIPQHFLEEM